MRKFCRNMAHPGYMNFGLKVFSASEKRERWMLKNDCPVDSKPWYLMTICLQTELQIVHWEVKLIKCHVWFTKSNSFDRLLFLIWWEHVYNNCLDVKAISLRILLLGTRYSPKSIQQAPMSDPNPSRNPMKNQTLAPWFPKQPVV